MIPTRTGTTIKNISENNSSTIKLRKNAVFLPDTGDDITSYNTIRIDIKSNVNSIYNGIELQQSDDNILWFISKKCTYEINKKCVIFDTVKRKYFRIKYTNGENDQNSFRIKTIYQQNIISLENQIFRISQLQFDPSGNLKISSDVWEIATDIKHITEEDTISALSTASSGANIMFDSTESALKLSINDINQKCISQSRSNIILSSGYSTKIYITSIINNNNNNNSDNIISRIGIYDNNNGIFYEYNSLTNIRLCIRQNNIDTYINKIDWNIDTLDGGGISNIRFDEFTVNTFVFEFNWTGISDVYSGILIDGQIYFTHNFKSFDSITGLLLSVPNLPIKCEIESNTETTNKTNGIMYIFSMFSYIKDNFVRKGNLFSITNASYDNDIDYGTSFSDKYDYVLFALRHNLIKNGTFIPLNLSIACVDSSDRILYKIFLYKTLDESINNLILNKDDNNEILNYSLIDNKSYLEKFIPNSSQIIIINNLYFSQGIILYQGCFSTFVDIDLKKIYETSRYFNIIKATGYNNGILTNMRDHLIITCKHIGSSGMTRGHFAFNWNELF